MHLHAPTRNQELYVYMAPSYGYVQRDIHGFPHRGIRKVIRDALHTAHLSSPFLVGFHALDFRLKPDVGPSRLLRMERGSIVNPPLGDDLGKIV